MFMLYRGCVWYLGVCVVFDMVYGCRILFCGSHEGKSLTLCDWLGGVLESPTMCFDERRATFRFEEDRCDCLILDLSRKGHFWRFQEMLVFDIDIIVLFDDSIEWFHRVYMHCDPLFVLVMSVGDASDLVRDIREHVLGCVQVHPLDFRDKIKQVMRLLIKSKQSNVNEVYNELYKL